MPRERKNINPHWVFEALRRHADLTGVDIDLSTLDIESKEIDPGRFGFKFSAMVGKLRKAATTHVEGKEVVIGWGDTETEAWRQARQHPSGQGHIKTWTIGEEIFDKIAAGDFDATNWGK